MANTTSLKFPNMFNVSQNKVTVLEDREAVVNRTRLLILTEPTELYNNPNFGVGLHRHMWKYNNENERAIIIDRIKEQLRIHEPYVDPDQTKYADGLLFTGSDNDFKQKYDDLEMTISVQTTFDDAVEIDLGNEILKLQ